MKKVRSALVSIIANIHSAGQVLNNKRALFGRTDKAHESIDVNKIAQQVLRLLREQLNTQGIEGPVAGAPHKPATKCD